MLESKLSRGTSKTKEIQTVRCEGHITSAPSLLPAETLFPDMKAINYGSPSGITITWSPPRDQVIHELTHYRVTYKIVSEAGLPVVNSSMFSVNVSANSKQLSLDGLKTYTVYKIKVESVSLDGKVHNKKVLIAGKL